MDEEKRAAFYQQHKDDPDVWGHPEKTAPRRASRGLSATITVRFSPEEAALIRRRAKETGLTYSDVVRNAVSAYDQPRLQLQSGVTTFSMNYSPSSGVPQRRFSLEHEHEPKPVITRTTGFMPPSAV